MSQFALPSGSPSGFNNVGSPDALTAEASSEMAGLYHAADAWDAAAATLKNVATAVGADAQVLATSWSGTAAATANQNLQRVVNAASKGATSFSQYAADLRQLAAFIRQIANQKARLHELWALILLDVFVGLAALVLGFVLSEAFSAVLPALVDLLSSLGATTDISDLADVGISGADLSGDLSSSLPDIAPDSVTDSVLPETGINGDLSTTLPDVAPDSVGGEISSGDAPVVGGDGAATGGPAPSDVAEPVLSGDGGPTGASASEGSTTSSDDPGILERLPLRVRNYLQSKLSPRILKQMPLLMATNGFGNSASGVFDVLVSDKLAEDLGYKIPLFPAVDGLVIAGSFIGGAVAYPISHFLIDPLTNLTFEGLSKLPGLKGLDPEEFPVVNFQSVPKASMPLEPSDDISPPLRLETLSGGGARAGSTFGSRVANGARTFVKAAGDGGVNAVISDAATGGMEHQSAGPLGPDAGESAGQGAAFGLLSVLERGKGHVSDPVTSGATHGDLSDLTEPSMRLDLPRVLSTGPVSRVPAETRLGPPGPKPSPAEPVPRSRPRDQGALGGGDRREAGEDSGARPTNAGPKHDQDVGEDPRVIGQSGAVSSGARLDRGGPDLSESGQETVGSAGRGGESPRQRDLSTVRSPVAESRDVEPSPSSGKSLPRGERPWHLVSAGLQRDPTMADAITAAIVRRRREWGLVGSREVGRPPSGERGTGEENQSRLRALIGSVSRVIARPDHVEQSLRGEKQVLVYTRFDHGGDRGIRIVVEPAEGGPRISDAYPVAVGKPDGEVASADGDRYGMLHRGEPLGGLSGRPSEVEPLPASGPGARPPVRTSQSADNHVLAPDGTTADADGLNVRPGSAESVLVDSAERSTLAGSRQVGDDGPGDPTSGLPRHGLLGQNEATDRPEEVRSASSAGGQRSVGREKRPRGSRNQQGVAPLRPAAVEQELPDQPNRARRSIGSSMTRGAVTGRGSESRVPHKGPVRATGGADGDEALGTGAGGGVEAGEVRWSSESWSSARSWQSWVEEDPPTAGLREGETAIGSDPSTVGGERGVTGTKSAGRPTTGWLSGGRGTRASAGGSAGEGARGLAGHRGVSAPMAGGGDRDREAKLQGDRHGPDEGRRPQRRVGSVRAEEGRGDGLPPHEAPSGSGQESERTRDVSSFAGRKRFPGREKDYEGYARWADYAGPKKLERNLIIAKSRKQLKAIIDLEAERRSFVVEQIVRRTLLEHDDGGRAAGGESPHAARMKELQGLESRAEKHVRSLEERYDALWRRAGEAEYERGHGYGERVAKLTPRQRRKLRELRELYEDSYERIGRIYLERERWRLYAGDDKASTWNYVNTIGRLKLTREDLSSPERRERIRAELGVGRLREASRELTATIRELVPDGVVDRRAVLSTAEGGATRALGGRDGAGEGIKVKAERELTAFAERRREEQVRRLSKLYSERDWLIEEKIKARLIRLKGFRQFFGVEPMDAKFDFDATKWRAVPGVVRLELTYRPGASNVSKAVGSVELSYVATDGLLAAHGGYGWADIGGRSVDDGYDMGWGGFFYVPVGFMNPVVRSLLRRRWLVRPLMRKALAAAGDPRDPTEWLKRFVYDEQGGEPGSKTWLRALSIAYAKRAFWLGPEFLLNVTFQVGVIHVGQLGKLLNYSEPSPASLPAASFINPSGNVPIASPAPVPYPPPVPVVPPAPVPYPPPVPVVPPAPVPYPPPEPVVPPAPVPYPAPEPVVPPAPVPYPAPEPVVPPAPVPYPAPEPVVPCSLPALLTPPPGV